MLPLVLVIVAVLWFVIGQFLSRKIKSVAIGYSVGLLAALIVSVPFIMATASMRDYFVQKSANAAGFASVQEYRQAQSRGYSTKASYDQGQAELEAARRSARESHVRLQQLTAAADRRRQQSKMQTDATRSSQTAGQANSLGQPKTTSGPTRSFSELEREVRALLGRGERLNRKNFAMCEPQMLSMQPRVTELRTQINQLPLTAERVRLGTAASHLILCVSCHPKLGPEQCILARGSLRELG